MTKLSISRLAVMLSAVLFFTACSNENQASKAGQSSSDGVAIEASASNDNARSSAAITVYSSRAEHLIQPLFEKFTEKTGIAVRYITDKEAPLIARLQAEETRTSADLLLTVDAGNLWYASSLGLLQPVESSVLEANIPEHLQAPDNNWFGLSVRARAIVYSTERVSPSELSTYEALADEKWKGRLCLRTSKKVYNQSLVAGMIAVKGEAETQELVEGWVNNLAVDPLGNDTLAMEAVEAGVCDLTVVNSYYFGRLQAKNPDVPLAIFWPNQSDRGVHVNVSGIGITRHAKHPERALQLIEWLSSPEAQKDFAGLNKEYPVNPEVAVVPEVAAWGEFKQDLVNVEQAGRLQADAIKLMDRAGYR